MTTRMKRRWSTLLVVVLAICCISTTSRAGRNRPKCFCWKHKLICNWKRYPLHDIPGAASDTKTVKQTDINVGQHNSDTISNLDYCRMSPLSLFGANIFNLAKVMFEDILAEPDGAHSADCVWRNSYKCFNCTKGCCYKLLTFLCGIPLAFCWGCEYACISFDHIWQWTPCLRAFSISLGCFQKFFQSVLNACLAPFCETCALCFSKISVANQ